MHVQPVCMFMYVSTYACMYLRMRVRTTYVYTSRYVCMCVYMYVCIIQYISYHTVHVYVHCVHIVIVCSPLDTLVSLSNLPSLRSPMTSRIFKG